MPIETLDDWNDRLAACGCCLMPDCPAPSLGSQHVMRSLCAMTANPSESHINTPSPNFDPANGGVPFKEANVAYKTMRVTDSSSHSDEWGSSSDSYEVTVSKNPETAEDNRVGVPAFICARTRVDGSWTSEYTTKDEDGNVTGTGTDSGTWTDELATPFGATPGTGTWTSTWTIYDEDGNVEETGSDSGESNRTYGPAWFWFLNAETITTTVEQAGLRHEVSGGGRNLIVQFEDPHTDQTAFAAITTPDPPDNQWFGVGGSAVIASFVVGRADEPNNDMRVTGAIHRIGRYRWRIPWSHKGPKFKLWWDEGFFSKAWLAWKTRDDAYKAWQKAHDEWEQSQENPKPPEPQEPPQPGEEPAKPSLTPKSFFWSGPGNADDWDDDSWFSPYSSIVRIPSATEGQVEICNVRYLCYESKFGAKPQVHAGFRIYNPDET